MMDWKGLVLRFTARYTPVFAPGIRLYVWLLRRAMRRLVKEHPQLQNSERESQKLLKKQGVL